MYLLDLFNCVCNVYHWFENSWSIDCDNSILILPSSSEVYQDETPMT